MDAQQVQIAQFNSTLPTQEKPMKRAVSPLSSCSALAPHVNQHHQHVAVSVGWQPVENAKRNAQRPPPTIAETDRATAMQAAIGGLRLRAPAIRRSTSRYRYDADDAPARWQPNARSQQH